MDNIKITKNKDSYIKEGIHYDRITTVLGYFTNPGLVKWQLREKNYKQVSKVAKQIGTRVHNLTLVYDKVRAVKLTPNDSKSIVNCMEAYKRFKDIEKPTYIESEYTVFNEGLRIAGTMDRKLATKEVLDIKTSNSIRLSYWLQLAMYNYLDGEWAEKLGIVRLDKFTGEYEYKVIPYDKRLVNVFIGLLDAYRFFTCNIKEKGKEEDDGKGITCTEITDRLGLQKAEDIDSWPEWYRQV